MNPIIKLYKIYYFIAMTYQVIKLLICGGRIMKCPCGKTVDNEEQEDAQIVLIA